MQQKISCPNCATQIDVNSLLYQQVQSELHQNFEKQLTEQKRQHELQLQTEKLQLENVLKAKLQAESEEQFRLLQEELTEKSQQVKELNRAKAEIERVKREKDELKEILEASAELKLNETLRLEKQKFQSQFELQLREKDLAFEDLKNQLKEAQRSAEQGSVQRQGEAQELAIEEWLHISFPLDEIKEIKKGQTGADCLQIVNTREHYHCGAIYYESKRTKEFGRDWIEKFKTDLRMQNATVGVLVTQTMPREMDRMGLKDGIWVCTFDEFKGLSAVLRESVIQINNVVAAQENKGEKMAMLYHFLTSQEFKGQIDAILEGFSQMREDLYKERQSMERLWKQREKQIEKVLLNTNQFYGSIKGIAGSAIPELEADKNRLLNF